MVGTDGYESNSDLRTRLENHDVYQKQIFIWKSRDYRRLWYMDPWGVGQKPEELHATQSF